MKDTGIGCACAVVIGRRDAAFIDTQSPLACAAFSAIFCLDTCVSEPLPGGVAAQGGGRGGWGVGDGKWRCLCVCHRSVRL